MLLGRRATLSAPIAMNLAYAPPCMDLNQAVEVLWFYFGDSGLFTLVDGNDWSYDRAEKWLCDEASYALLRKN
jgi:hypothetical protein